MAGNLKNLVIFLAVSAAVIGISTAATLTVGDKTGWTIPPSTSFYTNWASSKKIQVGDSLVFTFTAGSHTVAEVSKADYDSCNSTSPLSAPLTTGPATITLTSPGSHYFLCTFPGHCSAGQKLAVVAAGPSPTKAPKSAKKASPAPAPAPAPSTVTAAAPTTVNSTAPISVPAGAGVPISIAPGTAAPPAGNFAAANAVGFVGLVSVAVAALLV